MVSSELHGEIFKGEGAMDLGVTPVGAEVAFTVVVVDGVSGSRARLPRAEFERLVDHLVALRGEMP